jgi:acyl-CoA thioester hydrolase
MSEYRFYYPLEIRYGDIDAQRHVNNARYFTFMEQARVRYFEHLGLWDGRDFDDVGIILLEASCTFKAPIQYGQQVRLGARVVRLGNKSIEMEYRFEEQTSGSILAEGRAILVSYDYHRNRSRRIPDAWREAISEFEGLG